MKKKKPAREEPERRAREREDPPKQKAGRPKVKLRQLLAILDGMDEPVYISDPDTHEVLYANRSLKDAFGKVVGRKCYRAFQSLDSPCDFCSNKHIFGGNLGKTHIWEFQNAINKRWYRCIDRAIEWPDGRNVRCEIAIDITDGKQLAEELANRQERIEELVETRTAELLKANEALKKEIAERKRAEKAAKRSLELERAVMGISSNFVGATDIDKAINTSLADMGQLCGASRTYIYLFKENATLAEIKYEWCAEGQNPLKDQFKELATAEFPWGMSKLRDEGVIEIKSVSDLPPEAAKTKALINKVNVKSALGLPLHVGKELAGFIGFGSSSETGKWDAHDLSVLRIASEIIGQALERKRAREALIESREKYRNLVETMNDGLAMLNENGLLTYVNDSFCKMLGYSRSKMVGNHVADFAHESDKKTLYEQLEKRKKGGAEPYELMWSSKDGRKVSTIISPKPLFDSNGAYNGAFAVITDVTELKLAEEALKMSEEKWRSLAENAPNIILIVNRDGLIQFINHTVLGLSIKNIIGKYHSDFIEPEHHEIVKETIEKVFQTGEPGSYKIKGVGHHGSTSWYETQVGPIKTGGQVVAATLIVTDITERKKVEEERDRALKERERVMETVPDVIYALDLVGNISSWNRMLEEITGYSREEIGRMHALEFFAEKDRGKVAEAIEKVYREGRAEVEADFITKDRRKIRYTYSGSTLTDEKGNVIGITGVGKDIAELRRAEAEKESLREQLVQSQKMEAIGTLAGGMAHDFNNTLAVIMGSAETALRHIGEDAPNSKRIRKVLDAARRSKDLTMKLLTFTRKEKLHTETVSMNTVVTDLLDMLDRGISKDIEVKTKLAKNLPNTKIDINQIQQAMLNICLNAADAMPDGGFLTIETSEAAIGEKNRAGSPGLEPGKYCLVVISDTGHGIPDDIINKIFEPFFTTKERGKGTGLGLSITLGIIKGHGGHIDTSSTGRGTTVKVYLPATDETAPPADEGLRKKAAGGSETILVVDDDGDLVEMIVEALEMEGYKPLGATSGGQALELYQKHRADVDLVMLDMIMPEINGRDTFNEIKKLNPDANVILCSGYSEDSQAKELLDKGAMGYIQKPFDLESVLASIRNALDRGAPR